MNRSRGLIFGFLLIMILVNVQILFKERDIATGRRLVLALAPVDPRSLMQGDYMTLRYQIANDVPPGDSGYISLKPDTNDFAETVTTEEGESTLKLRFSRVNGRVQFGIESFLFQEGERSTYQAAKYAELRVSESGVPTLVNLLDENFRVVEPG